MTRLGRRAYVRALTLYRLFRLCLPAARNHDHYISLHLAAAEQRSVIRLYERAA